MKNFRCDQCGIMVFFENDHCTKCGEPLGFDPGLLEMASRKKWESRTDSANPIRKCANYDNYNICNWLVSDAQDNAYCVACRLNQTIPDLNVEGNQARWSRLELAKRRCLYIYMRLGLPIAPGKDEKRLPLRFRFLADTPHATVITGHDQGIITINIAEADGDERERRRLNLHEPYRTLVGHIRHETGHYYWDRFIANSGYLQKFRALFGDETLDYNQAMQKYYQEGPAKDWADRCITPYASWHPWEDWAETWAHYLHIVDTLETAASLGLGLNKSGQENETPKKVVGEISSRGRDFDRLMSDWQPLTLALNSINRSMGILDLYPFIIPRAAVEKLRFIHDLIEDKADKHR